MKKILVIYHTDCSDGFGGAFAAWKKFGKKADYLGLKPNAPVPRGIKNKEIYIIDYSFKEAPMKQLLKGAKKVIALDHHVSARKTTEMADEYVYALKQSGAVIAWNYFHPKKPLPMLFKHIQDFDLWKFKMPETKSVMAYLGLVENDFKVWDRLVKDFESSAKRKIYYQQGRDLRAYEDKIIKRLLEGAELAKFAGRKTLVVNSPVLHSEVGAALYEKKPPMSIVWSEKNGQIRVSLRSNGKVDVSKIAAKYGGGGHRGAAGFAFPAGKKAPWKLL